MVSSRLPPLSSGTSYLPPRPLFSIHCTVFFSPKADVVPSRSSTVHGFFFSSELSASVSSKTKPPLTMNASDAPSTRGCAAVQVQARRVITRTHAEGEDRRILQ